MFELKLDEKVNKKSWNERCTKIEKAESEWRPNVGLKKWTKSESKYESEAKLKESISLKKMKFSKNLFMISN